MVTKMQMRGCVCMVPRVYGGAFVCTRVPVYVGVCACVQRALVYARVFVCGVCTRCFIVVHAHLRARKTNKQHQFGKPT